MDVRKEYLKFFESKGHRVVSSMPLVPDDPTLLFTNAGMVQFKDIFTGAVPAPKNKTATSCQLCVRAGGKHNDLENVGYTARHHTLFEMLGNFSFGDYFKKEAIAYAWEFITKNLELPIEKLWVTVHESDDEAFELWQEHINASRIKRFGDKDNFWSMGDTGACGPCSEIFYDQGEENFGSDEDYLGGEGDRFLEIWNLVFMQYERDTNGNLNPLPKPSIDTGMGLERVVAIKEGKFNNFDSSLFMPLIEKTTQLANKKITDSNIGSFRVIADHLRAVSFMISQGILFDKEGRGYVLRRILRRAVRHGYLLGFRKPFLAKLVDTLDELMGAHYTAIKEQKEYIKEQITLEEDRFFKTIDSGMSLFEEELKNTKKKFSGEIAFKLYDTFGFPLDLTQDMLRDKNLDIDIEKFEELMAEQRNKAKAAWKGSGDTLAEGDFKSLLEKYGKNKFVGYEKTASSAKIISILNKDFKEVNSLEKGNEGWIMLDKTPFYAESGGQAGDIGVIEDENHIAEVIDTKKFFGLNLSQVKVTNSNLKISETIDAVVVNRYEIAKHHSATHLLQTALKMVLGENVAQAGSLNDSSRLRFDFTYAKAMTNEQLKEVEDLVNSMIVRGISANIEELPIEEAKKKGAIAMFGEKYGDRVRVVDFGGVSIEFCGGTHVRNSADIGSFYIIKESGVSAGVRRIEAVCGVAAINYTNDIINKYNELQNEVKNQDVLLGIKKLKEQVKELKKELETAQSTSSSPIKEEVINDVKVVVDIVKNADIKKIVDDLKNANEKLAVLLLQPKGDKVMIVAGCKNTSVKAGDWIKNIAPIVGGGGGGRPDFAQAGGKDVSKIDEAKQKALEFVKANI
ncbi:alanine--tRNA ligase [Malaciobacter molluscorum LMG 25693]|uniref:Alanine--tRNA ligase n=1 Tax=Malaciobacter molluscorum LMG 25693 TaxID=870501 RepID=A0A2G1DF45_9BACT|nr:alanine--tRNA ligase [Malaciobacter molluscorum]AXX91294.1 alanyl-tRNA synthetase [Malaciobacter molluscorum LMG 25693]PHO17117.1 alanine--tRNA ligase [Malaciobacter molluscorum LMG 25693]